MMEHPHANDDNLADSQDDFRQIKGIGETIDRALHDLGIHRFSDLARYTPDTLANALHDKVSFISPQRIEKDGWIPQAKTLSGSADTQPLPQPDAPGLQNWGSTGNSHKPQKKKNPSGWRELADFFVSFGESSDTGEPRLKTRAHYSQADQLMEWDGIATTELLQWMVTQGSLPLGQTQAAASPPPPQESQPVDEIGDNPPLAISNLWVSQVDLAAHAHESAPERRIRVDASIGYAQDESLLALPNAAVSIDIFLVNLETNQSIFIENPAFSLTPEPEAHDFQYDFPVPPPGRYQLYLLARYSPHKKKIALQQGPVVRVI
jgi:hypothetical protein